MSGNKELFEILYRDYHALVLQLCKGFMKGEEHQARDLSQEVFINIWRSLGSYRHEAGYKTWIYRITVNTCLKYIRDKKIKQAVPLNEELFIVAADESLPATGKPYEMLYRAIGALKEVDRLIIMMVLNEVSYGEISSIMGMSEGTLRVRISRIKKNLKQLIENE